MLSTPIGQNLSSTPSPPPNLPVSPGDAVTRKLADPFPRRSSSPLFQVPSRRSGDPSRYAPQSPATSDQEAFSPLRCLSRSLFFSTRTLLRLSAFSPTSSFLFEIRPAPLSKSVYPSEPPHSRDSQSMPPSLLTPVFSVALLKIPRRLFLAVFRSSSPPSAGFRTLS